MPRIACRPPCGAPQRRRATASRLAVIEPGRIRHSVVFSLHHAPGSAEERDFLRAAGELQAIPGVESFELLAEVSPKNDYRFAISMEFADGAAYAGYNANRDHVRFVEERWLPEVEAFLEVDVAPLRDSSSLS